MSALTRGFRNVYRNRIRTLIVIIILCMSIAVFLTMLIVDEGVNEGIEEVETSVDSSIVVRPAGSYGGFSMKGMRPGGGGGSEPEYVSEEVDDFAQTIPHVESTTRTLTFLDTGSFSMVTGLEPEAELRGMDGSLVVLLDGRDLGNYSSDAKVVVVSSDFSEENGVEVGDFIQVNDTELKVAGIFSSETRFGSRSMFIPIDTVQKMYGLEGQVSQLTVNVDSVGNIDPVYDEMRSILDTEELDIVHPGDENEEVVNSLETISDSSELGALVALAVGCGIVFFIMLLVTRERRREIGTLKALGASDGDVLKQFMVEAMTIAILGAALGLVVAAIGGGVIAQAVVGGEAEEDEGGGAPDWLNDEQKQRWEERQTEQEDDSTDANEVFSSISYGLSMKSVVYAFAAAILIGGLGILYPALKASRMRPVEALRYE